MFWKYAWAHAHGGPCGGGHRRGSHHRGHDHDERPWRRRRDHISQSRGGGRGPFGVRRPLRYMARQLDLDEEQVEAMAAILDDLKTQRAQARVDRRKAIGTFADAFLEDTFDTERVQGAARARAESEKAVEEAVAHALERTFAILDPEQRKRLAYLLRSDGLSI